MVEIPEQFRDRDYRFILVKAKSKQAIEKDWQNTANYEYDTSKIKRHKGNIGLVCGYGGIIVLDIDNSEDIPDFEKEFNDTLQVETNKGKHFYFKCKHNFDFSYKNLIRNKKRIGEVRVGNCYVLIPNSTHPSGKQYKIINNNAIKEISKDELVDKLNSLNVGEEKQNQLEQLDVSIDVLNEEVLNNLSDRDKDLILKSKTKTQLHKLGFPSRSERDNHIIVTLLLKGLGKYIQSVFERYPIGDKYNEHANGEEYLNHSIEKAREYTGIVSDDFKALLQDIEFGNDKVLKNRIDYYLKEVVNVSNNWFEENVLLRTIELKTKLRPDALEKRYLQIKEKGKVVKVRSALDILNMEFKEIEWWIKYLIAKEQLIIISARAGTGKSFLVLSTLMSLLNQKQFLGVFEVGSSPKVLYYDMENSDRVRHERMMYLIRGNEGYNTKAVKNLHFIESFNRYDLSNEVERAKDYDIVIIDPYRACLEGDENNSEVVRKFFNDYLDVLRRQGKTIIVVHHLNKPNRNRNKDSNPLDALRGSSDIGAQFDLAFSLEKGFSERVENAEIYDLTLSPSKNREGLPIQSLCIRVTKDDTQKKAIMRVGVKDEEQQSPKERGKDSVVEFVKEKGEAKRKEIEKAVSKKESVSGDTIIKWVDELVNENRLKRVKQGVYKVVGLDFEEVNPKEKKDDNQ